MDDSWQKKEWRVLKKLMRRLRVNLSQGKQESLTSGKSELQKIFSLFSQTMTITLDPIRSTEI